MQRSFLVYLFIGWLNTFISLVLYGLMIQFSINYLMATSLVYVFGIVEGYIFSSLWVFKHEICLGGLIKYSGVYAVAFIINLLLMYISVDIIGLHKLLAQIIVMAALPVLNYQLVKIFA